MPSLRSIRPFDVLALLIAAGALVAGIVVWDEGSIAIGMTLEEDTHGLTDPAGVIVGDVTPDGNAARAGFHPLLQIIGLDTVGGRDVELSEPIQGTLEGPYPIHQAAPWDQFGPVAHEIRIYDGDFRVPVEAVAPAEIGTVTSGSVDSESHWINTWGTLDRGALEERLRQSIWIVVVGIALGVTIWRFLAHGLGGEPGKERAVLVAAAAATPFLLLPVVQVGTPMGIYAGYLVPIVSASMVGLSLSTAHADRSWTRTSVVAALLATGMAVVLVVRYMSSPALSPTDRGAILVVVAAIAVVPAAISATPRPRRYRDRGELVSIALVPAAALTLFTQPMPDAVLPIGLMTAILGWQLLPVERAFADIATSVGQVRAPRVSRRSIEPVIATWRDRLTYGLLALVTVAGITQHNTWAVIVGVGLAAVTGVAVRRGFLGEAWTDAAVPLGAAVGIPVIQLSFEYADYSAVNPTILVPVVLAALSVAHLLATRHSEPEWRMRLFGGSIVLSFLSLFLGATGFSLALVLVGLIPLIPGVPIAFAEDGGESRALSERLETLVVALTPGAAATALVAGTNLVLLGGWLVAVFVWRQFTLTPLIGLARRTQLQRDVAVAAAETERARLAADLHDDALQQLTMLVRTLDEGGQTEAANEAREVATKLRSVVGDLRLPILDDLGAGAALEWLVERVEPLAGGTVKLERSDETRPPANVELAVFRVAQEALTNAIKHGRPPIAVRYDVRTDGRVTLAIDDAGEGIGTDDAEEAPHHGHLGLLNMQQRAEQIGALLDVRRWPSGGTRVALEWRPQ